LLQDECQPERLAAALEPLLAAGETRDTLLATFAELHHQIRWNADEQAAAAVLELCP